MMRSKFCFIAVGVSKLAIKMLQWNIGRELDILVKAEDIKYSPLGTMNIDRPLSTFKDMSFNDQTLVLFNQWINKVSL